MCFPIIKVLIQHDIQIFRLYVSAGVQIQMQHRIFNPVLFQLFHRQAFEKVLLAREICIHRGYEKAFAKPARTAEEIISP